MERGGGGLGAVGMRPSSVSAAALLLSLLHGSVQNSSPGPGQVGLSERVLGLAQALWPLAVVLSCRLSQARARVPPPGLAGAGTRRLTVREWVKQAGRDAGTSQDGSLTSTERRELAELRREIAGCGRT